MGVVYRALQRSLHRVVALKMILRGELASSADVARSWADISLSHDVMGYAPEVGFREGLERTVEFYERVAAGTALREAA